MITHCNHATLDLHICPPPQILSAFSDGLFVSPAVVSASTFARKTEDAYFYHFNHSPKSGPYAAVSQSVREHFSSKRMQPSCNVQGSAKRWAQGLVNLVPGLAFFA